MTYVDRIMVAVALATALWWRYQDRRRPSALEALSCPRHESNMRTRFRN
jgi:hypothetical protein